MNKIKVTFGKPSDNVKTDASHNGKVQKLFGYNDNKPNSKSIGKVSPEKIYSLTERSVSSNAASFGHQNHLSKQVTPIECPSHIFKLSNSTQIKENKILILDPSKEGEAAWIERQSKWKEEDLAPPWLEAREKDNLKPNGPITTGVGLLANAKNVHIGAPTNFDVVPIEDFGLSMVVGMGYDPSSHGKGKASVYQPAKRAYFRAGIGAENEFLLPHEKAQLHLGEDREGSVYSQSSSSDNDEQPD